jgi:hypothetical protein
VTTPVPAATFPSAAAPQHRQRPPRLRRPPHPTGTHSGSCGHKPRSCLLSKKGNPPPSRSGLAGDERSDEEDRRQNSRALNPRALPSTPGSGEGSSRPSAGSPQGLCFSIPSDSDDDEDDLLWPSPKDKEAATEGGEVASSKGKEVAPACSGRSSSGPARRPAGGFMADARRQQPRSPPPARSTEAPQGRAQVVPLVDAEGFRLVVSKRRLREGRPPPRQQPTQSSDPGGFGWPLFQLPRIRSRRGLLHLSFEVSPLRG